MNYSRSKYCEILPPGCPNLYYEVSMKINRYLFAAKEAQDKTILDIGCATGYGTAILKNKGAGLVIGTDMSQRALRLAKRKFSGSGISFLQSDVQSLPFTADYFDMIVCFEIIEHLPEYRNFIQECHRVLKPGGVFYCSTPNKQAVSPDSEGTYRCHHYHEFYPDELSGLLSGYFSSINIYGYVRFSKKEKKRDDALYKLAASVAPHLPLPVLNTASAAANCLTWIPALRPYQLIKIENIQNWDSFYDSRFQPYPLDGKAATPLGLFVVARGKHTLGNAANRVNGA